MVNSITSSLSSEVNFDKIIFLGAGKEKTEPEKFIEELLEGINNVYFITKDEEIAKSRKSKSSENIIMSDIFTCDLSSTLIIIPYGSTWISSISDPGIRYKQLSDSLFRNKASGILYIYLEEDAKNWGMDRESFLGYIEKALSGGGYILVEFYLKQKDSYLLLVK